MSEKTGASAAKAKAKKSALTKPAAGKAVAKKTVVKKTAANKAPAKQPLAKKTAASRVAKTTAPALLAGGNPQIAKGYGDEPVQAYIAAMPDWKSEVGRRLDALIERTVPGVHKAVKWNSPLYGIEGQGWFLGLHCFAKYVKVAFFRGAALQPVPPVESKSGDTRYFPIHEHDPLDETQLADWVRQASRLPGERM